jgi:hypothetical protein
VALMMLALRILVQLIFTASFSTGFPLIYSRGPCFWSWDIYSCTLINSENVSGATIDIYTFKDVPASSPYPTYAEDAAKTVMAAYHDFLGDKWLNVMVFVVPALTGGRKDANALTETVLNTCRIQIVTQEPLQSTEQIEELAFKETLAHELYHCVQGRYGQIAEHGQGRPAKWWIEGTATYFAHAIYPKGPQGWIMKYEPKTPLYLAGKSPGQGDGDTAAVFFQYLSNSNWTDLQINDFMLKQTFVNSFPEELSRISLDTHLRATFPTFATSFLDEEIHCRDGSEVQEIFIDNVQPEIFSVPDTADGLFDKEFSIIPWNIQTAAKTSFASEKVVSMAFTANDPKDDSTILQYYKINDKTWHLLKPGDTANLQVADGTACQDTSNEYYLLLTSTFDPSTGTGAQDGSAKATIRFSVTEPKSKRDNTCPPKPPANSTGGITDQCLVGDWSLDIPSMQTFLAEAMSKESGSGAVITNLAISGSAGFSVSDTFASTMTLNHLTIGYDGAASGLDFHTDIDVDATVTGDLVKATGGVNASQEAFTWAQIMSTGTVNTTTTVAGLGDPISLDMSIDSEFGNQTTVQYECAGSSLTMMAYVGGKYSWGYAWIKK